MSTKTLKSVAEEYFYSINTLAGRIGEDITSAKEAYEGLWNTLSLKEQHQAIDETIIQPEVALKYASKKVESPKELSDYYPKLRIQTGMKYVIDETGSTLRWKDEHSAPFSFMTQSQMNLNLFEDLSQTQNHPYNYIMESPRFSSPLQLQRVNDVSLDDEYDSSSNPIGFYQTDSCSGSVFSKGENGNFSSSHSATSDSVFKKLINRTSFLNIQDNDDDDDLESLIPQQNTILNNLKKDNCDAERKLSITLSVVLPKSDDASEETTLLDTPGSFSDFQCPRLSTESGIPKTGFEFLDNW